MTKDEWSQVCEWFRDGVLQQQIGGAWCVISALSIGAKGLPFLHFRRKPSQVTVYQYRADDGELHWASGPQTIWGPVWLKQFTFNEDDAEPYVRPDIVKKDLDAGEAKPLEDENG